MKEKPNLGLNKFSIVVITAIGEIVVVITAIFGLLAAIFWPDMTVVRDLIAVFYIIYGLFHFPYKKEDQHARPGLGTGCAIITLSGALSFFFYSWWFLPFAILGFVLAGTINARHDMHILAIEGIGFWRTMGCVFNKRLLIEETIKKQEQIYRTYKSRYSALEPHELLDRVWLSWMCTYGRGSITPEAKMVASAVTCDFACMPEPANVRSLAVYMLYKEYELEIESNPKLQELLMSTEAGKEFDIQVVRVAEAKANGTFMDLYEKYNPNCAKLSHMEEFLNQDSGPNLEEYRLKKNITDKNAIKYNKLPKLNDSEICGKEDGDDLDIDEMLFGKDVTKDQEASAQEQEKEDIELEKILFREHIDEKLFADGSKYVGEIFNGKPDGEGKYVHPKGFSYKGQWEDGKYSGYGKCTFPDGSIYTGQWKNNKFHGQGKYVGSSGEKYEGEWKDGLIHGQGRYTGADGYIREGVWEKGEFVGNNKINATHPNANNSDLKIKLMGDLIIGVEPNYWMGNEHERIETGITEMGSVCRCKTCGLIWGIEFGMTVWPNPKFKGLSPEEIKTLIKQGEKMADPRMRTLAQRRNDQEKVKSWIEHNEWWFCPWGCNDIFL